jgi:hypothetical protein
MNSAAQYQGRLFTLVNQFSFATPPVSVREFAVRAGAKRKLGIDCHTYESQAGRCDGLDNEP